MSSHKKQKYENAPVDRPVKPIDKSDPSMCDQSKNDPCKPFGCELQACYMDMHKYLAKSTHAINDKGWCLEEKEKLNRCREEHGLPVHK
eukprot:UN04421